MTKNIHFMCQDSHTLHNVIYHPNIYGESAKRDLQAPIKNLMKIRSYMTKG